MSRSLRLGRARTAVIFVMGTFAFAVPSLLGLSGDAAAQECPGGGTGCLTEDGTQPGLDFLLLPPSSCAGCHGNYDTANDIEPWNTWAGTMMSQASRDPVFWAALDVANNDVLNAGRFCLRCHTPVGWMNDRCYPETDGCVLEGFIDDFNDNKDFDGITCDTCHRLEVKTSPPAGEQPFYLDNAKLWLDDDDCPVGAISEPCRRGPYDYVAPDPDPPHAWAASPYHESSDLCGNCHNVTNPLANLIDEGGNDTGIKFPIERTYKEWSQSSYADTSSPEAKTCQNCHMRDSQVDPVYACNAKQINRTDELPVHEFVGANTWIPGVIKGEYVDSIPELAVGTALDAATARALDMLQNRSASLEITVPASDTDGAIDLQVKVTNLAGHKLPTGYGEGRRMWIHVEVRDVYGNVVWESGAYDPTLGELIQDSQVKIYAVEQGIWNVGAAQCEIEDGDGDPMFHFVLNNCIHIDNRIPPLGFTGGSDPETRPVAYSYPETSPGVLVNYDTTDYTIDVSSAVGPVTVTAALRHQVVTREYASFLLAEATEGGFANDCLKRTTGPLNKTRGQYLWDLWNSYGMSPPTEMASATDQSAVTLPPNLTLSGKTVSSDSAFGACNNVTLGPGFVVEAPAQVTIVAGSSVTMIADVEVQDGAGFTVEIDPTICP